MMTCPLLTYDSCFITPLYLDEFHDVSQTEVCLLNTNTNMVSTSDVLPSFLSSAVSQLAVLFYHHINEVGKIIHLRRCECQMYFFNTMRCEKQTYSSPKYIYIRKCVGVR